MLYIYDGLLPLFSLTFGHNNFTRAFLAYGFLDTFFQASPNTLFVLSKTFVVVCLPVMYCKIQDSPGSDTYSRTPTKQKKYILRWFSLVAKIANYASQCQGQGRDKQRKAETNRDKQEQAWTAHSGPCLSLLIPACACLSLSVPVRPCLSLYVPVCPYHTLSPPLECSSAQYELNNDTLQG